VARSPRTDVAKFTDGPAINQEPAEDMSRGAAAEPEKVAEAAHIMMRNVSPLDWLSLQHRFAQVHFSSQAPVRSPARDAGTLTSRDAAIRPCRSHAR
jgi:hypothetical protein